MRVSRFVVAHPRLSGSAILVAILCLWQLAFGTIWTGSSVVATPTEIADTIVEDFSVLSEQLTITARGAAIGLVAGIAFALGLALLCLAGPLVETNVFRVAIVLNSIPLIVLAPIIVIWFGAGSAPRVIVAAMAVFFGVLVNAVRGLRSARRETEELFHVLAASRLQFLRYVRLPSSLPFLFSALRVAVVAAVLGAVIGEWVGASDGLGVTVIFALYQLDTPSLWAAMTLLTLFALAGYLVVGLLERIAIPWHASIKGGRVEASAAASVGAGA